MHNPRIVRTMKRLLSALALPSVVFLSVAGCSSQVAERTSSDNTSGVSNASIGLRPGPANEVEASSILDTRIASRGTVSSTGDVTTSSPNSVITVAPTTRPAAASSPASRETPTAVPAITAATKAPTAAQLKSAQRKFGDLARSAFPGLPAATVVRTAKMLCTTLGQGASLHDEVGQLAGQVGGQSTAEDLVRAAVGAYCPTVKLH